MEKEGVLLGSGVEGTAYLVKDKDGNERVLKKWNGKRGYDVKFAAELQKLLAQYGLAPKVYTYDTSKGTIEMEYVKNTVTWKQFLQGDLDKEEMYFYIKKLILVLGTMYDLSIIHGDLNPGNILIETDGKKRILLIDMSVDHSVIHGKEDEEEDKFPLETGTIVPSSNRDYRDFSFWLDRDFGRWVDIDRLMAEPDAVQNWRHYLAFYADMRDSPPLTNYERALEVVTDQQVQYTLLMMWIAYRNSDKDKLIRLRYTLQSDIPERYERIVETELSLLENGEFEKLPKKCTIFTRCFLHHVWIDLYFQGLMKEKPLENVDFEQLKEMVRKGEGDTAVLYATLMKGKLDLMLRMIKNKRREDESYTTASCDRCGQLLFI